MSTSSAAGAGGAISSTVKVSIGPHARQIRARIAVEYNSACRSRLPAARGRAISGPDYAVERVYAVVTATSQTAFPVLFRIVGRAKKSAEDCTGPAVPARGYSLHVFLRIPASSRSAPWHRGPGLPGADRHPA